ncbi:MAG: SGNH/GDSL hydrolase family protein [Actinomycetota bacterium]
MRKRWITVAVVPPVALTALLGLEIAMARGAERLEPYPRAQLDGSFGSGAAEPLRMVWMGDSTGDGVGASSAEHALPRVVAAGLNRPVQLSVLAHSGDTVADVLRDQVPALAGLRPQWVFIGIGGNDVTHLTSRSTFKRTFSAILDRTRRLQPEKIVVIGIGQFAATPLLAQPLRFIAGLRASALADDQRNLAHRYGATFVDIIGDTGSRFVADPKRYHARDRFHPSDEGYRLWAEATLAAISR